MIYYLLYILLSLDCHGDLNTPEIEQVIRREGSLQDNNCIARMHAHTHQQINTGAEDTIQLLNTEQSQP